MELCFADHGTVDKVKQSTKIQIAVGNEGLKRINTSGLSDEDQKEPEKLWNLFEEQLSIKVNFRIHRLEFMKYRQRVSETIDDFC